MRLSHFVAFLAAVASFSIAYAQVVDLPTSFVLPSNAADASAPGFKVRVVQADPGEVGFVRLEASSARAEAQLAGALINAATRQPYADIADKSKFNPDGTYDEPGVIDYEQAGNATGFIPGVPEGAASTDDIALEALTYLDLQPGTYTMIVNSDDGFRVSAGPDARDWFERITVGEAEGGRSAADSSFDFSVSQAGLYSFRLLWYEAGGGANVSWYSGSERILINDQANGGPKAYRAIAQPRPTYIRYVSPAPNATEVSRSAALQWQIGDGDVAQVDPNSIALYLNDLKVPATVSKSGSITKVTYSPPTLLPSLSDNKVRLVYRDNASVPAERTEEYSFKVTEYASITLPAPIYFENFDATAEGSLPAGWSGMSYTDESGSSSDIDFGNLDSAAYAKWTVVNVDRFKGSFVTYSNPDNSDSWEKDYQRVLSFNPKNIVNDQVVTNLAAGRFLFGDSGYRNGASQVLYVSTPDFDLTGKTEVNLSFHSLWEQNQDSLGLVEYSIDGGQSWLPVVYMITTNQVIKDAAGAVDAVATLTTEYSEVARYTDPATGEEKGGTYGAFIGAEITPALAPFISGRIDDDKVESKRVELFRLEKADNQPKVRIRFGHAGTDSWYFGVDDFGLYSMPAGAPALTVVRQGADISLTWSGGAGITLQKATALGNGSWEDVPGTSGLSTFAELPNQPSSFYRLLKR